VGVRDVQVFSLLAIFFALLVAIFAIQNAVPVEINFLVWQFRRWTDCRRIQPFH